MSDIEYYDYVIVDRHLGKRQRLNLTLVTMVELH